MKFLCDRCKTRYSIADERVRGKILKIRCKNCAHVVTVREGMTDEDPDVAAAEAKAATEAMGKGRGAAAGGQAAAASAGQAGAAGANGTSALADAFARVMQPRPGDTAPPPAALDEDWYVSLEGKQEGPFTLAQAQAWVSSKKATDELFCWCEGFDDWLPTEKVSHFRGLRVTAAPAARAKPAAGKGEPPGRAPASGLQPAKDEPQPLFAATLAALENDVADDKAKAVKTSRPVKSDLPAADPRGKGTEANDLRDLNRKPDLKDQKTNGKATPATPAKAAAAAPPPKPGSKTGAKPAAQLFDLGDAGGAPPPEPELDDDESGDDDDGLEIGEVSRVVRLNDLAAAHAARTTAQAQRRTGTNPALRTPAPAIARGTGGVTALGAVAAAPEGAASAAALAVLDGGAQPEGTAEVLSPIAARARKSHAVLFLGAGVVGVLVAGLIVVVAVNAVESESGPVSTGDLSRFDDLGRRIDDPRRVGTSGTGGTDRGGSQRKGTFRRVIQNQGGQQVATSQAPSGKQEVVIGPDGQPVLPLTPDDILQVSSRMSMGTKRCYERALKEDPFLKVSKIIVTLTVGASGTVSDVQLASFQNTNLGKCLTAAIKRWPFRRSTEGLTSQFGLVFEQR